MLASFGFFGHRSWIQLLALSEIYNTKKDGKRENRKFESSLSLNASNLRPLHWERQTKKSMLFNPPFSII